MYHARSSMNSINLSNNSELHRKCACRIRNFMAGESARPDVRLSRLCQINQCSPICLHTTYSFIQKKYSLTFMIYIIAHTICTRFWFGSDKRSCRIDEFTYIFLGFYSLSPKTSYHRISMPRDMGLGLPDFSDNLQASRQHCCRSACKFSQRYDNFNIQFRVFETSRNLLVRCLTTSWIEAEASFNDNDVIVVLPLARLKWK